jgi:hypothetical protein
MATSTVTRIVTSGVKKYVLDNISGHGCVMGFSLYKLTNAYKGYCLEVQRQSDSATLNVGFINGYVDKAAIDTFCVGTNGSVKTWYNQFGANNASQSTFGNMPVICESGVFVANKFVAASSTKLTVLNYVAIDIIIPTLTVYNNILFTNKSNANIFSKSSGQYSVYYANPDLLRLYISGSARASVASSNLAFKFMGSWSNTDTGGVLVRDSTVEATGTCATTATAMPDISIGGTAGNYFSGYITTALVFNTNQYNNYNKISGGC